MTSADILLDLAQPSKSASGAIRLRGAAQL